MKAIHLYIKFSFSLSFFYIFFKIIFFDLFSYIFFPLLFSVVYEGKLSVSKGKEGEEGEERGIVF